MTNYADLDEQIVAYVMDGRNEFWKVYEPLRKQADALATPNRRGEREGWRVIDRRLQALRKAGKLAYDRKAGWSLA